MENELIEVSADGQFSPEINECEFIADYQDFQVKGLIEVDIQLDEAADESVGIMNDSYRTDSVRFWFIKVIDNYGEEISISPEAAKEMKQDIENHFDKLTQEF